MSNHDTPDNNRSYETVPQEMLLQLLVHSDTGNSLSYYAKMNFLKVSQLSSEKAFL